MAQNNNVEIMSEQEVKKLYEDTLKDLQAWTNYKNEKKEQQKDEFYCYYKEYQAKIKSPNVGDIESSDVKELTRSDYARFHNEKLLQVHLFNLAALIRTEKITITQYKSKSHSKKLSSWYKFFNLPKIPIKKTKNNYNGEFDKKREQYLVSLKIERYKSSLWSVEYTRLDHEILSLSRWVNRKKQSAKVKLLSQGSEPKTKQNKFPKAKIVGEVENFYKTHLKAWDQNQEGSDDQKEQKKNLFYIYYERCYKNICKNEEALESFKTNLVKHESRSTHAKFHSVNDVNNHLRDLIVLIKDRKITIENFLSMKQCRKLNFLVTLFDERKMKSTNNSNDKNPEELQEQENTRGNYSSKTDEELQDSYKYYRGLSRMSSYLSEKYVRSTLKRELLHSTIRFRRASKKNESSGNNDENIANNTQVDNVPFDSSNERMTDHISTDEEIDWNDDNLNQPMSENELNELKARKSLNTGILSNDRQDHNPSVSKKRSNIPNEKLTASNQSEIDNALSSPKILKKMSLKKINSYTAILN